MIIAVLIFIRLLGIMFIEKNKWKEEVRKRAYVLKKDRASRGDIYDAKGKLLATSVHYYNLFMDMKAGGLSNKIFDNNVVDLADSLAIFFKNKSKKQWLTDLRDARKKGNRAFVIAHKVSNRELKIIKQFPILKLNRNVSGLVPQIEIKRERPFGNLLRRTIGYISENRYTELDIGMAGIEKKYDRELLGSPGEILYQKLANNVLMAVNKGTRLETDEGTDIVTAIDINMQDYADSVLREQLFISKASHGSVVVMEVKTGYIKAMVNLQYGTDSLYSERLNHAVGETLAPGSTFKLPVLIAALEDKYVKLTDTIDIGNGHKEYFGVPVDDDHEAKQQYTVREVFEKSSNVGMAEIVNINYVKTGKIDKFLQRLYDMGFGKKTGIDIAGEKKSEIKNRKHQKWSNSTPMMMSHGYELKISPLQILTFYNAIANNGMMMKPQVVTEFQKHGETIKVFEPEVLIDAVCSEPTIKKAHSVLRGVVERGTASGIKIKKFKVAGKTGTAKYYDVGQKKHIEEYRASFVGYFPAENPKYSCIVVINKPQGNYYGAQVAVPVFEKIANKIYSCDHELNPQKLKETGKFIFSEIPISKSGYKDDADAIFSVIKIPIGSKKKIESEWITTNKRKYSIEYIDRNMIRGTVPSVIDMGAKDAVFLLETLGIKVNIRGRGTVRRQSIPSGTRIKKNMKINIWLY